MKGKTTMIKRYLNTAILYAILAMIFGVFYREFTKFNHFTGKTNLSVMHTHYFLHGEDVMVRAWDGNLIG